LHCPERGGGGGRALLLHDVNRSLIEGYVCVARQDSREVHKIFHFSRLSQSYPSWRERDSHSIRNARLSIGLMRSTVKSALYGEVIVKEVLKRRDVLLELNEMRNPEANKRKTGAWKEIQEIILTTCKKLMTIDQIERTWRNKKSHVKDVLMTEKRYRSFTGGGVDMALENAIRKKCGPPI
ncbi:hypothetical protein ANCCAN_09612, partial [Ancylostoma caninum]